MRRKSIKYVTFRQCNLRRSGFIAHRFHCSDCIQSFRVAHNSGHVRGSTLEPISAVVIRSTYFLNARCIRCLPLPRPISTLLGRQPVRGAERRAAPWLRVALRSADLSIRTPDSLFHAGVERLQPKPLGQAGSARRRQPGARASGIRGLISAGCRRSRTGRMHPASWRASQKDFIPAYVDRSTRLRHVSQIPRCGGRPQRKRLFRDRRSRRMAAVIGPAPITACRGPSVSERVRR